MTATTSAAGTVLQPVLTARQRKAIRAAALCTGTSYPIVVVPGSDRVYVDANGGLRLV